MVTSKLMAVLLVCVCSAAVAREAASPTACQAAAGEPAITSAREAVERDPRDLPASFVLADAWSDAGCFNDAVQVLQRVEAAHPENQELKTRLRVARSLVGEEHFFDNLDRADADAKFKRDLFRCTTLSDLDACTEAARLKPDDPSVLIAQGDALVHANHPVEALSPYRRAAPHAANPHEVLVKINAIESQLAAPPRVAAAAGGAPAAAPNRVVPAAKLRVAATAASPAKQYSNAAPEGQSH